MRVSYCFMVGVLFYGVKTILLDACCSFGVANQRRLLFDYRRGKSKPSNALDGSYHPPCSAKSTRFGNISFDPDLPLTALSYHQQSVVCYARTSNEKGAKLVAGFPTPTGEAIEAVFSLIDGMLLGDGAELIEAFESANRRVCFTRNSSMSKLQRLKLTFSGEAKKAKWSSTHPDMCVSKIT